MGCRKLTFAHARQAQRCVRCTFQGSFSVFSLPKGNLIRIETGLDTFLIRIQTRTPLSRYPPYDHSKIRGHYGAQTTPNFGEKFRGCLFPSRPSVRFTVEAPSAQKLQNVVVESLVLESFGPSFRKIRAAIKIKSALPPPQNPKYPPPPKTRNFMDMGFFLQKERIFSRRP